MSIRIEVWGKYALFTRPELKTERCSYDTMTPSAARGIVEAIFWHPGMKWIIDKICVLKEIQFTNIRRNEVSEKISAKKVRDIMDGKSKDELFLNTKDCIAQRAATVLRDVRYIIEAHFEMTAKANASDNPGKFQDIITRRIAKGQCYHTPYLGCREFPAYFSLPQTDPDESFYNGQDIDLSYMLYDMDYRDKTNIQPMFFRARLKDGIIDLTDCEVRR